MKIRMNLTSNQLSFEYAMYFIAASYFKKADCKSPFLEKKMRVQYLEQKPDNQYQMEEICIRFMEKVLMKHLPDSIWDEEVQVHLLPYANAEGIEVRCIGRDFTLRLRGEYKGRKRTRIRFKV